MLPDLRRARRLGAAPSTRTLGVTVTLRVRDQGSLDALLSQLYAPSSPEFRQFLTPRQFEHRFAPTAAARAGVIAWLRASGLRITGTSGNGLQIFVSGRVPAIERTFATSLASFRRGAQTFTANTTQLRLPGAIASDVLAVSGLTSSAHQQPMAAPHAQSSAPNGFAPSDITSIYDMTPLVRQGSGGSAQTIAVASFADYDPANISTFDQQFGLTAAVSRIAVSDGVSTGAQRGARNGQDEADTDIEVLQGIAPKANILVYEAPNTDRGALNLYNKIVSDDRASIITTSWGGVESSYPADELNAIHQALQEGAAQGQSFFAASGDAGAYDGAGSVPNGNTTLAVDFPASDPWVTGVGGTTLVANGTSYVNETTWADTSDPNNPVASGGGLSSVFKRPSYQAGPGVDNQYSNGMRQVPDVAADADPSTGYAVYTVDPRDTPTWGVTGGTSVGAPVWAGFAALVNAAVGHPLGSLNPYLYALGQKEASSGRPPFHDVVEGTNLYYPATPGWDFATGWGSPDGAGLLADLQSLPAPSTPAPSPTPRPTSTPTPAATVTVPAINVDQVLLLHRVNGKLKRTGSLKLGESGILVIFYSSQHAGPLHASGRLRVQQKGKILEVLALKTATYQGRPVLEATVRFTSKKRVGTILAQGTVSLGSTSTAFNHAFKLLPLK
ncbi:MAG TPA: S53 family peptidase [Chloroflexota bacterium]|nr:S53 family peptidase [Chloroflexota bacterium]